MRIVDKVLEFQEKQEVPCPLKPTLPDKQTQNLAYDLIAEELEEFHQAQEKRDLEGIADAIADLLYTVVWASNVYGLPLPQLFDEVHRSNMSKFPTTTDCRGKVVKSSTYRPPRVDLILRHAINGDRDWDAFCHSIGVPDEGDDT